MNSRRSNAAFTLIELLMVITIILVIAAMAAPTLKNFRKGDATQAATQQLLGAVARARQLAISQRTTVYMVFLPTNYWNDPVASVTWSSKDYVAATNLADKGLTGYNFVSLRTVGDQPGQNVARYLSSWQSLPESTMISVQKFNRSAVQTYVIQTNPPLGGGYTIYGFDVATNIPFPLITTKSAASTYQYAALPYISFDYLGRLSSGQDPDGEYLPLAQGGVSFSRDRNRLPLLGTAPITIEESNTNIFNLIFIDRLTGRARLLRAEVQ